MSKEKLKKQMVLQNLNILKPNQQTRFFLWGIQKTYGSLRKHFDQNCKEQLDNSLMMVKNSQILRIYCFCQNVMQLSNLFKVVHENTFPRSYEKVKSLAVNFEAN